MLLQFQRLSWLVTVQLRPVRCCFPQRHPLLLLPLLPQAVGLEGNCPGLPSTVFADHEYSLFCTGPSTSVIDSSCEATHVCTVGTGCFRQQSVRFLVYH